MFSATQLSFPPYIDVNLRMESSFSSVKGKENNIELRSCHLQRSNEPQKRSQNLQKLLRRMASHGRRPYSGSRSIDFPRDMSSKVGEVPLPVRKGSFSRVFLLGYCTAAISNLLKSRQKTSRNRYASTQNQTLQSGHCLVSTRASGQCSRVTIMHANTSE